MHDDPEIIVIGLGPIYWLAAFNHELHDFKSLHRAIRTVENSSKESFLQTSRAFDATGCHSTFGNHQS